MSSNLSTRKNGKQASCEPCRKAKIRCDHSEPCGRCRRRRIESRCWYHPAPLTKPRNGDGESEPMSIDALTPASLGRRGSFHGLQDMASPIMPSQLPSTLNRNEDSRINMIVDIISQLKYLDEMERLLESYYQSAQAALVPIRITFRLIKLIRESAMIPLGLLKKQEVDREQLRHVAECVMRSTASRVAITPDLDYVKYCEAISGQSLRLETLGLLYTLTARACFYEVFGKSQFYSKLSDVMFHYATSCLELAQDISPSVIDMMVWFRYEEGQVLTLVEGDCGVVGWRRVNALAGDIFTLGYHRESILTSPNVPFWLAEMRRRAFVYSYRGDKSYSSLLERPPQIPNYFCDCKHPLDLEDDVILSTPEEIEEAVSHLEQDGWSTIETFKNATWARVRYTNSILRDDMTRFLYRPLTAADEPKLRQLLIRCKEEWEVLPSYLHYRADRSESLGPAVFFMMGKVYLGQLYTEIRLHRLLDNIRPGSIVSAESVKVAIIMLDVVLQMASQSDAATFVPRDLPALFPGYGLVPATILATALREAVRNPTSRQLPLNFNRSKVIRSLSVFVSQMESICGPGRLNHEFCAPGAAAISRILDEALGSLVPSTKQGVAGETNGGGELPATPATSTELDSIPASTNFTGAIEDTTAALPEEFDPVEWAFNIDWASTNDVWDYGM